MSRIRWRSSKERSWWYSKDVMCQYSLNQQRREWSMWLESSRIFWSFAQNPPVIKIHFFGVIGSQLCEKLTPILFCILKQSCTCLWCANARTRWTWSSYIPQPVPVIIQLPGRGLINKLCCLPQLSELKLADSWYRKVQFLLFDMLYSGAMVHGKDHLINFPPNLLG